MDKPPYVRLNFGNELSGRQITVTQLVKSIRLQIQSETSLNGCRLPPVRVLAHQLGVSKNTIQNAYEELKIQGLIEGQNRIGLFIKHNNDAKVAINPKRKVPCPKFNQLPEIFKIPLKTPGRISLSSVFIDPDILPVAKLSDCFRSVLKIPGLTKMYDSKGLPALREKIAERLNHRGMDAHPNHILITSGSQPGLDFISRCLKSKTVATENPSYYLGKQLFEMNGLKVVGLPVDPFCGIDLESWEDLLKKTRPELLYLTTNFQNPTGYSYSSNEMNKIVEWSQEYGFGILEDDWGSDMLSYSEFRPGFRALGGKNVLYLNSFTKKLMPSLRVGYIVGNEKSIETIFTAKNLSSLGLPSITELVVFEFLDRGYYDTHLKNLQAELDTRYNHCLTLLRELMPENARWTSPGGGTAIWLELPKRIDLNKIIESLKLKNIFIQNNQTAFFGIPHLHGLRIGFGFPSIKEMEIGLLELSSEIKKEMNK